MSSVVEVQAENALEARALMFGVLNARNSSNEFDIRFEYRQEHYPKMQCRLEALNGKRRLEIFKGKDVRGEVTLIDEKYVWHYEKGEGEGAGADLVQMNIQQASHDGLFCFDPRVIGLTGQNLFDHDPTNMLVEGVDKFEFVGNEKIGEATVSRVRIYRQGLELDHWIEEPSMRLHRRTVSIVSSRQLDTDTISEFSKNSPAMLWLPSAVRSKRLSGNYTSSIEQIQLSSGPIDPSRFTIESLQLPFGTAVIDKIAHRRLGYWNGKEIVKDLFAMPRRDSSTQPNRIILLILSLGALLTSVLVCVCLATIRIPEPATTRIREV